MTTIPEIARMRVDGLPTYRAGKPSSSAAANKLSSNEAALGPGPAVVDAITAAASNPHRYPDESTVRELVAALHGISTDRILLTNGSDELCYLVADIFLGPGRIAVVGDPCYAIDATATKVSGATVVRVPLVDGYHDLDSMAQAAQNAQVVWLPSPHNPTGTMVDEEALERFLADVPGTCLVVLDQAYIGYAEGQPDVIALLDRYPNLLVQRTMSKDRALAGLRIGYTLAHPQVIQALATLRPPFSVNAMALAATAGSMTHPAWNEMSVDRIREGRTLLETELTELGIEYIPSQANFVLAKIDHGALAPFLEADHITVRAGEDLGAPGWVRITIGWAPTMATLRQALRVYSKAATT
jgi:histidinol-phosphate aminotransferase